ncbi:MAG TPA: bifunctional phosphoglucose/phosphomannose isomerase [Mycobacteriales bacterium]|nr:bifunctional phosphoglucose/phosphomannose isomerase [Mycobacteriales bacterium]
MILQDRVDALDDVAVLDTADPAGMLRDVAGAPAQLREAAFLAAEVDTSALLEGLRPRSVVVVGMGGSAIAGDVLAAVAGTTAPVPVHVHRGYGLPGWVGAADLVVGVSCSGGTEETLSAVEEAARRGAPLVGVAADPSPLAELVRASRGVVFPVPGGRQPRASIWALSAPLLVVGDRVGVARVTVEDFAAAADVLDEWTDRCRPTKESFLNPAKELALGLVDRLPVLWGTSPVAGVAAYRGSGQLAENAKTSSVYGVLPEANHNQVVAFDAGDAAERLTLVLLRDSVEHPQVTRRADVSRELADARGIPVHELRAEGEGPLARLASLIALVDFTSVYAAFLVGVDPTPVEPIVELKARIRE